MGSRVLLYLRTVQMRDAKYCEGRIMDGHKSTSKPCRGSLLVYIQPRRRGQASGQFACLTWPHSLNVLGRVSMVGIRMQLEPASP